MGARLLNGGGDCDRKGFRAVVLKQMHMGWLAYRAVQEAGLVPVVEPEVIMEWEHAWKSVRNRSSG